MDKRVNLIETNKKRKKNWKMLSLGSYESVNCGKGCGRPLELIEKNKSALRPTWGISDLSLGRYLEIPASPCKIIKVSCLRTLCWSYQHQFYTPVVWSYVSLWNKMLWCVNVHFLAWKTHRTGGKLWGIEKNILFKDYSETWLLNKVLGKKRSLPTCDKTDVKNL